ncbi:MAG: response regulator, partial [Myxococcales bacterium]|nr:response regulator [Myxococcales bacterium]
AHDFNNLLSTILANADLARLDCERGSERARALERITTATRHAAELTDQLLNYVGRGIRSEEALALNEIIEGTRELFRASLPKDGRLFTTLASGLPPVRGDRSMLRQVAMNLMLNAAEALRGPGEIRVTTALETVTESELVAVRGGELPPGRYVVLRVADTGCGMDEQTLSRIFDPFFSTKFTGRGLGLAATLGIAREHRGGIAVRSRAGEGTEFAVFLPPDELPGEAPRELARPDATRWETSGVALLADDEAYVREALAAVLRRAGMEVIEVDNGAAAVLAFSRGVDRFRIVILDQIMPVMSGSEAMEAIRAMRADVPIVLTSGYTEDAIRLDPGAAPAHHFLRKPFGVRDIESIVREALGE